MSGRIVRDTYDVPRHSRGERITHWIVAITFVLVAASGLAFFHPLFWPLVNVLGGGTWARILHPIIGLVTFVCFAAMALAYWRENLIQSHDLEWRKRLPDILNNRDDNLPEIDKYNFGQKQLFWALSASMVLLAASGVVLWRDVTSFPIPIIRIAAVVHALAAFVTLLGIVAHVYSAVFWVRGALRGMTRGTVGRAWAKHHHPLWYRRVMGGQK